MNKILIDTNEYNLDVKNNYIYEIDNLDNNTNINIDIEKNLNGTINILIKNSQVNININLHENSNLIINQLGINSSVNIISKLSSNSNLEYIDSIISDVDSINDIKIIQDGENSKCIFLTNGINLSNNRLFFIIDGIIKKNSNNSYLEENSKIINIRDGNSKIIPNLLVDNKDVIANHSAFIGKFNEEEIRYLNTRGISLDEAKKLLLKSILFSKMENNERFINYIELENIL